MGSCSEEITSTFQNARSAEHCWHDILVASRRICSSWPGSFEWADIQVQRLDRMALIAHIFWRRQVDSSSSSGTMNVKWHSLQPERSRHSLTQWAERLSERADDNQSCLQDSHLGLALPFASSHTISLTLCGLLQVLQGQLCNVWDGLHVSSRTCPSRWKVQRYVAWFLCPTHLLTEPDFPSRKLTSRLQLLLHFAWGLMLWCWNRADLLDE